MCLNICGLIQSSTWWLPLGNLHDLDFDDLDEITIQCAIKLFEINKATTKAKT